MDRSVVATGIDFSGYTKNGFHITPEQYLEPYESVGLIKVFVAPEVRKGLRAGRYDDPKWEKVKVNDNLWLIERLDAKEIIDQAYKIAFNMGADAIVRFSVVSSKMANGELLIPYYEVTGFAIKRKAK